MLMSRQGTAGVDYAPVRAFYQLLECHDANTRTLQDVHLTSDSDCAELFSFRDYLWCAGSVEQEQQKLITIQPTLLDTVNRGVAKLFFAQA